MEYTWSARLFDTFEFVSRQLICYMFFGTWHSNIGSSSGSERKDFPRVIIIYGHGIHLGNVAGPLNKLLFPYHKEPPHVI